MSNNYRLFSRSFWVSTALCTLALYNDVLARESVNASPSEELKFWQDIKSDLEAQKRQEKKEQEKKKSKNTQNTSTHSSGAAVSGVGSSAGIATSPSVTMGGDRSMSVAPKAPPKEVPLPSIDRSGLKTSTSARAPAAEKVMSHGPAYHPTEMEPARHIVDTTKAALAKHPISKAEALSALKSEQRKEQAAKRDELTPKTLSMSARYKQTAAAAHEAEITPSAQVLSKARSSSRRQSIHAQHGLNGAAQQNAPAAQIPQAAQNVGLQQQNNAPAAQGIPQNQANPVVQPQGVNPAQNALLQPANPVQPAVQGQLQNNRRPNPNAGRPLPLIPQQQQNVAPVAQANRVVQPQVVNPPQNVVQQPANPVQPVAQAQPQPQLPNPGANVGAQPQAPYNPPVWDPNVDMVNIEDDIFTGAPVINNAQPPQNANLGANVGQPQNAVQQVQNPGNNQPQNVAPQQAPPQQVVNNQQDLKLPDDTHLPGVLPLDPALLIQIENDAVLDNNLPPVVDAEQHARNEPDVDNINDLVLPNPDNLPPIILNDPLTQKALDNNQPPVIDAEQHDRNAPNMDNAQVPRPFNLDDLPPLTPSIMADPLALEVLEKDWNVNAAVELDIPNDPMNEESSVPEAPELNGNAGVPVAPATGNSFSDEVLNKVTNLKSADLRGPKPKDPTEVARTAILDAIKGGKQLKPLDKKKIEKEKAEKKPAKKDAPGVIFGAIGEALDRLAKEKENISILGSSALGSSALGSSALGSSALGSSTLNDLSNSVIDAVKSVKETITISRGVFKKIKKANDDGEFWGLSQEEKIELIMEIIKATDSPKEDEKPPIEVKAPAPIITTTTTTTTTSTSANKDSVAKDKNDDEVKKPVKPMLTFNNTGFASMLAAGLGNRRKVELSEEEIEEEKKAAELKKQEMKVNVASEEKPQSKNMEDAKAKMASFFGAKVKPAPENKSVESKTEPEADDKNKLAEWLAGTSVWNSPDSVARKNTEKKNAEKTKNHKEEENSKPLISIAPSKPIIPEDLD